MTKLHNAFLFILLSLFILGCHPRFTPNQHQISKKITQTNPFENHFAGFVVYNPKTKDTLVNTNGYRYFTPASNVKIFTLYAALKMIPEHLESLRYTEQDQRIYFRGTGDPTPLHPYFKDSTLYRFLKEHDSLYLVKNQFKSSEFGPGWAWEDFDAYYSSERSALPLYGNVVSSRFENGNMIIDPNYFTPQIKISAVPLPFKRNRYENQFYIPLNKKDTLQVPFITSDSLNVQLLSHALHKQVQLIEKDSVLFEQKLYGIARDSILKRMMFVSDNFLAEQMIINAGSTVLNHMNSTAIRNYVLDSLLPELKQRPRWVDGSGLSRYNLFSPLSMVQVLEKMYREFPTQQLFTIFPMGGVNGTLEKDFSGGDRPYLYAKTGSLGNNYSLSGYLITDKGTLLIFSFMNNHYTVATKELKKQMQEILLSIKQKY